MTHGSRDSRIAREAPEDQDRTEVPPLAAPCTLASDAGWLDARTGVEVVREQVRSRSEELSSVERICKRCGEAKPAEEFSLRERGRRRTECRSCRVQQAWLNHLLRNYHLTEEQWEVLKRSSGGRCAICGLERKLFIDHDHKTEEVRGFSALGATSSSVSWMNQNCSKRRLGT